MNKIESKVWLLQQSDVFSWGFVLVIFIIIHTGSLTGNKATPLLVNLKLIVE